MQFAYLVIGSVPGRWGENPALARSVCRRMILLCAFSGRCAVETILPGAELLTTEEMARADRIAVAGGTPGLALMEAAGSAVAAAAAELAGGSGRGAIAVACGPGNNGGDGFVAARLLREAGYSVRAGLLGSRDTLRGDAAAMAVRWAESGGAIEALSPETLAGADVIVDAMFGAGLSRPLDGAAAQVVEAINAADRPVVAVDVPSGLDGTSGKAAGPVVHATRTVTFFR